MCEEEKNTRTRAEKANQLGKRLMGALDCEPHHNGPSDGGVAVPVEADLPDLEDGQRKAAEHYFEEHGWTVLERDWRFDDVSFDYVAISDSNDLYFITLSGSTATIPEAWDAGEQAMSVAKAKKLFQGPLSWISRWVASSIAEYAIFVAHAVVVTNPDSGEDPVLLFHDWAV